MQVVGLTWKDAVTGATGGDVTTGDVGRCKIWAQTALTLVDDL